MVFVVLNVLLTVFLFLFATAIESHSSEIRAKKLSNLFLLGVGVTLLISIAYFAMLVNNMQLYRLIFEFVLFVTALFSIKVFAYVCAFPQFKKSKLLDAFALIMIIGAVLFLFMQGEEKIFIISRMELYRFIYLTILPVLSIITCLWRMLTCKSIIFKQQILANMAGIIVGLVVLLLIERLNVTSSFFSSLFSIGVIIVLLSFYGSTLLSTIYDIRFFLTSLAGILFQFVIVGIIAGSAFAFLYPLSASNSVFFAIIISIIFFALLLLRPRLSETGKKLIRFGSDYANILEEDFKKIDYNEPLHVVAGQFRTILDKNIETSSLHIFVENAQGTLVLQKTQAETDDNISKIDVSKKTIDSSQAALELLINLNQSIVFKSQVLAKFEYNEVKENFLELFDSFNAEALILLREDRHIFALIMLGSKRHGGQYTEYDYKTFSKLLSYFFVFAYYLKNIAHESLVGTVNREIDYSEQIIHSIQENMDFIRNPKVDVEYISFAARKLGGNFIDFIKISSNKYIFVMGDVSGKGLNASLSMVILKSVVRTYLTEIKDFKQLVVKVNEFIKCNLPRGTFFAGVFALFDFATNTMYYINCGIPAMLLYTESYNMAIEIQGVGKMLGFVKDVSALLKVKKTQFNAQDILVITTNGIINAESLRGDLFGKERIQKFILENKEYPASRMTSFLKSQVTEFTAKKIEDDVTILVLKYLTK